MTVRKPKRRRSAASSRAARELNIADAATMLIMLRHDVILSIEKIDKALSLLIGMKAVRELQRQQAQAADGGR